MMSDAELDVERVYPYRNGWQVACCSALAFGILGGVGAALLPYGCQQVRNGPLPLGIALVVIGLFTTPMLLFAVLMLLLGAQEAIRPPSLRVTPDALHLPSSLCDLRPEQEEQTDQGEPKEIDRGPAHPAVIPFSAIRWVRRELSRQPPNSNLMIVHDLSPRTLVIEQVMMRREDFDDLETVLRAAIPSAFGSASSPP